MYISELKCTPQVHDCRVEDFLNVCDRRSKIMKHSVRCRARRIFVQKDFLGDWGGTDMEATVVGV